MDAHLPPLAELPAPVQGPALGLDGVRLGGDGDDGPDPLAQRAGDQRDQSSRQAQPAAAGAGTGRGQHPAPRSHRRAAVGRGEDLAGGGIRPAPAVLRAPAEARPRLFRRPADRTADVAGDRRPLGDPVLPRLRPDLHHPERADDRPGLRRDDRDQPAAGAGGSDPGADRGLRRLALQPGLPPGPAGGAAADRRADRGGRGEHLRDPHRQVVRPRGTPAAPLPALGGAGLRPEHLRDPAAGASSRR